MTRATKIVAWIFVITLLGLIALFGLIELAVADGYTSEEKQCVTTAGRRRCYSGC